MTNDSLVWQQLVILSPTGQASALDDFLFEEGAVSTTWLADQGDLLIEQQPGQNPGLWARSRLLALFEEGCDLARVKMTLQNTFPMARIIDEVAVVEEDWQQRWMDHYEPVKITEKLWVCPSWCTPPDSAAVNIMLDPGMAFGTGTHPTTAMCLLELTKVIRGGETLIDVGCGSGILGIAAAKLGCKKVIATDIDPKALEVTAYNAEKNGLSLAVGGHKIETEKGGEKGCIIETYLAPASLPKANIIVANILANPLIQLRDYLVSLGKEGGYLILSGLLVDQVKSVQAAYRPLDLKIALERDGWALLVGKFNFCAM